MHRGFRSTTSPLPRCGLREDSSNAWFDVFDVLIKLRYSVDDLLFAAEILKSLELLGLMQIF